MPSTHVVDSDARAARPAPKLARPADEPLTDATFVRACERGDIPAADFHHVDHLRLALGYLVECQSADEAIERMAATLRGFAARAGHPEKYHHTMTVFWIRMVSRLLDSQLPFTYYSPERLTSEAARNGWLEPDLKTL